MKKTENTLSLAIEEYFSRQVLEELSESFGEDALTRQIRLDAYQIFSLQPLPHGKMEEWRRTDIRKIPFEQLKIALKEKDCPSNVPHPPADLKKNYPFIHSCDGVVIDVHNVESLKEKGVIVSTWHDIIRENPDLAYEILQNPLERWEYGKFVSMNAAFFNTGLLIIIPRGVRLEKPIHHWAYFAQPNKAYFPRVTIIVEEGAEFTFFENLHAPLMNEPVFINGVTELIVKENARLNFSRIQNLEDNGFYLENGIGKVWRDGRLYHFEANLGAGWAKTKFECKLAGTNAEAILDGVYFANQKQHLDQKTMQYHLSPHTRSDLNYHGVVTDRAHTIYQGMIRAEKEAMHIDAYQSNKNLVLSDDARADSIPGLEILANDLRCTHGATIGKVDPEQIFYLQSRGLDLNDARQLIVAGFLEEVVVRIPSEEMRTIAMDIINGKIMKEITSERKA